jgi:hypothetical protein
MSCSADVSLFSEVLESCGHLLEVGKTVVMNISCTQNDNQLRINADKVQLFDKNYSNAYSRVFGSGDHAQPIIPINTQRTVRIKITDRNKLEKVKALTDNFGSYGEDKLELMLSDGRILALPGKYFITSYDILDLKNAAGIDNVEVRVSQ